MRPLTFSPDSLRKLLLHDKIATLPDLKRALGTDVDLTVFRKLKELDYLTSYSHGGRFYTLREIARFGADGLWSCTPAWFSATVPCWPPPRRSSIAQSPDISLKNCRPSCTYARKMSCVTLSTRRGSAGSRFLAVPLYFHRASHLSAQSLTRRATSPFPMVVDAIVRNAPDEMKPPSSVRQSRWTSSSAALYAGLESMKLGHGGDSVRPIFWPRSAHHRPRPSPVAGSGY